MAKAQAKAPEHAHDRDDSVALLTDMIFSAVGARERIGDDRVARAAAVRRVQQLLQGLIMEPAPAVPSTNQEDWSGDIVFGRMDAECMFREPGAEP